MHLLPLPIAYALFEIGYSSDAIMYCIIAEELICLLLRVLIARIDANVPIEPYARDVIMPCVLLAVFTFLSVGYFDCFIAECHLLLRLILTTLLSIFIVAFGGYFLCLSNWEKANVNTIFAAIARKVFRVRR